MVIPYFHDEGNIEKLTQHDYVVSVRAFKEATFRRSQPEIFLSAECNFRSFPSRKRESHFMSTGFDSSLSKVAGIHTEERTAIFPDW